MGIKILCWGSVVIFVLVYIMFPVLDMPKNKVLARIAQSIVCLAFLVFIILVIAGFWHDINYYNNIESHEERVAVNTEKRPLVYFCYTQKNSVVSKVLGMKIFYEYKDENGFLTEKTVYSKKSEITYIDDLENPYVEIITYQDQVNFENHNNGEEHMRVDREVIQYHFYLPSSVKSNIHDNQMIFSLN